MVEDKDFAAESDADCAAGPVLWNAAPILCKDSTLCRSTIPAPVVQVNNSGLFDEVTSAARALVTDSQRNVMARSFPKFFNKGDKLAHRPADHADFTVQEKLDGSMGLLFHFEGKWHISSRGSFDNSQVRLHFRRTFAQGISILVLLPVLVCKVTCLQTMVAVFANTGKRVSVPPNCKLCDECLHFDRAGSDRTACQ